MEAVRTISLTKYYGKSRGIKDINLSVPEGDFWPDYRHRRKGGDFRTGYPWT